MNKMIVAIYDNESSAYEAIRSLRNLHKNGDITLYATAVIGKNEGNEIIVKQADEEKFIGTVIGIVSGAAVGFLTGPVVAAAGLAAGSLTGFIYDLNKLDIDIGFTDNVSEHLAMGKFAVIADAEEEWITPVDTELCKYGGIVFRRLRSEVIEDQLNEEAEALRKELQELKDKWNESANDAKDKIATDIIAIRQKLKNMQEKANYKIQAAQDNMVQKVVNLKQQIKDASAEKRNNLERRFSQIKSNLESRNAKLKTAANLTAEALSI